MGKGSFISSKLNTKEKVSFKPIIYPKWNHVLTIVIICLFATVQKWVIPKWVVDCLKWESQFNWALWCTVTVTNGKCAHNVKSTKFRLSQLSFWDLPTYWNQKELAPITDPLPRNFNGKFLTFIFKHNRKW